MPTLLCNKSKLLNLKETYTSNNNDKEGQLLEATAAATEAFAYMFSGP